MIDIAMQGYGYAFHSDGLIQLLDATTNTVLANYGWTSNFVGNVVWTMTTPDDWLANVAFSPILDATHFYVLTTIVSTNAATPDWQGIDLRVTGLHTVPEPASLILLTGALVVARLRQTRPRRRTSEAH
jgi:hypothetical protein